MRHLLPVLLLLLASLPYRAATGDGGIVQTKPPAGFEDLTEPQTAVVDLYFASNAVGSVLATFEPGLFSFENPEEVLAAIPDIADVDAVRQAITGPLDSNADRVCAGRRREDCGVLSPETAGVVFDEGRYRVDLFIAPKLLKAPEQIARFLGEPTTGFSFIESIGVNASGEAGEAASTEVSSTSLVAWHASRLRFSTRYTGDSDSPVSVDEAKVEQDLQKWRIEGGHYRSSFLPGVGDRRIIGAAIRASVDRRTDLRAVSGTALTVFLNRRSRVEIFRNDDDRLLAAKIYDSGLQRLDTSRLPTGAYDVRIVINEIGGGTSEEVRYFVNNASVPPPDQPFYTLEAGMLARSDVEVPATSGTPFLHGSTSHRLSDDVAVGGSLVASNRELALGVEGVWFTSFGDFAGSALAASDRAFGVEARFSGAFDRLGYSVSGRRTWAPNFVDIDQDREVALIGPGAAQAEGSLSYGFETGPRVAFRAFISDTPETSPTWSFGPSLFWSLWRYGPVTLGLNAQASRSNEDLFAATLLTLTWSGSGYRLQSSGGAERSAGTTSTTADVGGQFDLLDRNGHEITADASLSRGVSETSARLSADYAGGYGRAGLQVDRPFGAPLAYAADATVNITGSGGSVVVGGRSAGEAGVIIAVDGPAEHQFTVLIDNRPVGKVQGGGRSTIRLTPYRAYRIRLRPETGGFIDYDSKDRRVIVFPGNVGTETWTLRPVYVVFGRAVLPGGDPVANGRIEGAREPGTSDDGGYFQAELAVGADLLMVLRDGGSCRLEVPPMPAGADFVDAGDVTCRPDAVSSAAARTAGTSGG
ncbi:MAG: TcfC E-set like domain-containing protein [Pseudomonadota bacterium]|nr:TcfC E-set like domain-containing protein [Pseudomonadota bacterium]